VPSGEAANTNFIVVFGLTWSGPDPRSSTLTLGEHGNHYTIDARLRPLWKLYPDICK